MLSLFDQFQMATKPRLARLGRYFLARPGIVSPVRGELRRILPGFALEARGQFKRHTMTVFAGINGRHVIDRDGDILRDATKTGLKGDQLVAHNQTLGRIRPDVQNNLTILHKATRHHGTAINRHSEIGCQPLIDTPFMNGTNQIRLGGSVAHDRDLEDKRGREKGHRKEKEWTGPRQSAARDARLSDA